MNERHVYVYAFQLAIEASLVEAAKRHYHDDLKTYRKHTDRSAFVPVLLDVRGMITSAAIVSQIIFEGGREDQLHREYGIEDAELDNLLRSRDVRDSVMHIDERIRDLVNNPPDLPSPNPMNRRHLFAEMMNPDYSLGGLILDHEGDGGTFTVSGIRRTQAVQPPNQTIRYIETADAAIRVGTSARKFLTDRNVEVPFD